MIGSSGHLKDVLGDAVETIVAVTTGTGIEALYVGGTFLEADRTEESDIDLFAVVDEAFPLEMERRVNDALARARVSIPSKVRALYLSELYGGNQRGFITTLIPIRLLIRRMAEWPLVWGSAIDPSKVIAPYTLPREIEVQSALVRDYIERYEGDTDSVPFEWIPKAILYLGASRLALETGDRFTGSFSRIAEGYASDRDHIVHEAVRIRRLRGRTSGAERARFLERAKVYLGEA